MRVAPIVNDERDSKNVRPQSHRIGPGAEDDEREGRYEEKQKRAARPSRPGERAADQFEFVD